jgi:hypothetical protein
MNCVNNHIECPNCEGYFEIEYFYEKHENFCILLYNLFKEKEEFVDCTDCGMMIKFVDFQSHKEVCKGLNQNVETQKIQCNFCNSIFPLEMIEEHEQKCELEQNEHMQLKQKIKCSYCNENVPIAYLVKHETTCLKLKENNEIIEKGILKKDIIYPEEWGSSESLLYTLMKGNNEEYKFVEKFLRKSFPKISIYDIVRIQNKHLWDRFYRERLKIIKEKGSCEEKFLFNGSQETAFKVIYNSGFDISFSKEGEEFGRGIYFYRLAKNADAYSHQDGGKKYIFLAKVLTGLPFLSQKNTALRKPPFYDSQKFIYYDSVTNLSNDLNSDAVNQLYVIYNNEKAYPYYMIEYQ